MNTYLNQESATFTGHRLIPQSLDEREMIKNEIRRAIIDLYKQGIRNFFCGMAIGFDMLTAEVVLSLKDKCKSIRLISVLAFRDQDARFSRQNKERFHQILQQANDVIVLSEQYYDRCLLIRDDYMLDHSSQVIAFFDGRDKGGTFYTIRNAKRKGLKITNLFTNIQ